MMHFALICNDRPGALPLRQETRPAHLEFLKGLGENLAFAGPFTDDSGKPNGSLVVIEAEDQAAAEAIASADPYAQAGLFENVEIRPWVWALNNPGET